MNADLLKNLEKKTDGVPRGIGARIDSTDLRRLLSERLALLDVLVALKNAAVHYAGTRPIPGKHHLDKAIADAEEVVKIAIDAGHRSSDGCWIDVPPGPDCNCQSCRVGNY